MASKLEETEEARRIYSWRARAQLLTRLGASLGEQADTGYRTEYRGHPLKSPSTTTPSTEYGGWRVQGVTSARVYK